MLGVQTQGCLHFTTLIPEKGRQHKKVITVGYDISGSSLTPGNMSGIRQGVRRSSRKHLSFPPFPLFSISQLSRCPLTLKDDLTMSSFNNGFFKLSSLQLTVLLFCCQGDVPRRAPHTCSGSPPPSPPSGTLLHPFVTQSFLSWSQTFKITFILEQKKSSSNYCSASLHHPGF